MLSIGIVDNIVLAGFGRMSPLEETVHLQQEGTLTHSDRRPHVTVSLQYVFPGMEQVAKKFILHPYDVPDTVVKRVHALHVEGAHHLGILAEQLAQDMIPHDRVHVGVSGHPDRPLLASYTLDLSSEVKSAALFLQVRRKSLSSLGEKIRRYEELSEEEIAVMDRNGYQSRFEQDSSGRLRYAVADGNGIMILAPTEEGIYQEILPRLADRMHIVRVKDYIKQPKITGFRSLFVLGFLPESPFMTEVQVQTPEMFRENTNNLAGRYHQDKTLYHRVH